MGALLSFAAAPLAILIAKILRVRPEPRASVDPQAEAEAG